MLPSGEGAVDSGNFELIGPGIPSVNGNLLTGANYNYTSDSAAALAANGKELMDGVFTDSLDLTERRIRGRKDIVMDTIVITASKSPLLDTSLFHIGRASTIRSEAIKRQEFFTLGGRYSNADGMTVLGAVTQRNSLPNYASAMGQELVTTVPKAFANTVVDTFVFGTNLYLSQTPMMEMAAGGSVSLPRFNTPNGADEAAAIVSMVAAPELLIARLVCNS